MKLEFQNGESFLTRIKVSLPVLHRAEEKLGRFLLDFPGELASYDAQELARLSGVSKATVSRFVRRLGFEKYECARKAVREESRYGSRHFLAQSQQRPSEKQLATSLEEGSENALLTFNRIEPTELDALSDAIVSARRVWVAGYRISHSFAEYMYWQLTKVVPDASVIPKAGESLGEHLAVMQPDDVVIWVALRQRMANTDSVLSELQEQNIPVALITDDGQEIDKRVRWHFRCRIETSDPQFNHTSVLSVCHQIMTRATLLAGSDGRERLRRVDELNMRLGEV